MKKLLVLAMMATLLMAGSAFAIDRHLDKSANATFAFGSPGIAAGPTTTNNDDSCDIGNAPAATLLLPYFEVDVNSPQASAQTTLFTVTNVSRFPQIAHVTVWTDWSFPVLDFNIFLTGYDTQAINMYDVIVRGVIAPPSGTSFIDSTHPTPGALSLNNTSNNNILFASNPCTNLPGQLPATLVTAVRTALTTGVYNPGAGACSTAGGVHSNAIGYVTVDVAADCSTKFPSDPTYFNTGTGEILYDNVFIGDYQQLGSGPAGTVPAGYDAGGDTMVAIRAVPEGGGAGIGGGLQPGTNLPYTFYDRYTPALNRTIDRRQPLPATFAARYIQGGTSAFATNYKIWREGLTGSGAACNTYPNNATIPINDVVRFDEHENPFTYGTGQNCSPFCNTTPPTLPETSSTNNASATYPTLGGSDVAGWMYLNLSNGGANVYSVTGHPSGTITTGPASTVFGNPRASQNWVIISMFGSVGTNRLSVDFAAAWLGNGCSANIGTGAVIGPAGGVFVCPPAAGTTAPPVNMTNGTTTECTGTNTTPNQP